MVSAVPGKTPQNYYDGNQQLFFSKHRRRLRSPPPAALAVDISPAD